ncbi:NUDIX hydrolase [Cellulomonas sp. NPDC055163]
MSTTTRSAPETVVEAAGALVWRVRQERLQLALVHRPRYKDWSWPKGKLEGDETPAVAAVREVAEETGHDVVLGRRLPGLEYRISDGRLKRVHYWAAQVAGRPDGPALLARPPVPRASRDEIDAVRWVDADVARKKLTRAEDREPLDVLLAEHEKERLDTRVLVVARHGQARKRSSWPGSEDDRPLTRTGQEQAEQLVPVLSAFGVTDLVTSHWARCAQTLAPYAAATHLGPRLAAELTESRHDDSPARVAALVERLLGSRRDVVLCTHRPVLPTVLDVLAQHSRRPVADALPHEDPFLRPGEMLVAHVVGSARGPRLVATERHTPVRAD